MAFAMIISVVPRYMSSLNRDDFLLKEDRKMRPRRRNMILQFSDMEIKREGEEENEKVI